MKKSIISLFLVLAMLLCSIPAMAEPTNENALSDPRVRQAMAYAIDMQAIIDGLMAGKATVA
ncbi:MAG: ABC transporter substrate-binding protein, partial [Clostridia bacterium]